jgi:hypothetical protein
MARAPLFFWLTLALATWMSSLGCGSRSGELPPFDRDAGKPADGGDEGGSGGSGGGE